MSTIIELTERRVGDDTIQTVNARDLHAFLEVGKVFGTWIQDRIRQYGFVEHIDFEVFSDSGKNRSIEVFPDSGKNSQGGRPAKEYAISLDMAKELAMVERNDKGKEARRYFIECERRAKAAELGAPPRRTARVAQANPVRDLLNIGKAMSKVKGVTDVQAMHRTLDAIGAATGLPVELLRDVLPPEGTPGASPMPTQAQAELAVTGVGRTKVSEFVGDLAAGRLHGHFPKPSGPCLSVDLFELYQVWGRAVGLRRLLNMPRFLNELETRHGLRIERKRYAIEAGSKGPSSVVYLAGASLPPFDLDEREWLGIHVGNFRRALASYRARWLADQPSPAALPV